jgi:hypothetical protein
LFKFFIDDLIAGLDDICEGVYAYADDIATLIEGISGAK